MLNQGHLDLSYANLIQILGGVIRSESKCLNS